MAQGFSVRVYGTVSSQPPYISDVNGNLPSVQSTYAAANDLVSNFPTDRVNIWPILPGAKMNGVFCYGVIEVPPSGLQQYSQKFIVVETVATLATLRG
jgi:hypothetical protein